MDDVDNLCWCLKCCQARKEMYVLKPRKVTFWGDSPRSIAYFYQNQPPNRMTILNFYRKPN
jgi:hypothetical protein